MMLYLPEPSWLHRRSAGLKLLVLASMATGMTLFAPLGLLGLALAGIGLAYVSLGRQVIPHLLALKPLLVLIAALFVLQAWSLDVRSAALITLRMLSLVLLAQLVTLTTRLEELLQALHPLLKPLHRLGLAPHRIAFAVAMVIRFIPVLLAQYSALRTAWQARGGRRRPWVLLSPLLIQSLQMTEQVALAIAARGGIPDDTGESDA